MYLRVANVTVTPLNDSEALVSWANESRTITIGDLLPSQNRNQAEEEYLRRAIVMYAWENGSWSEATGQLGGPGNIGTADFASKLKNGSGIFCLRGFGRMQMDPNGFLDDEDLFRLKIRFSDTATYEDFVIPLSEFVTPQVRGPLDDIELFIRNWLWGKHMKTVITPANENATPPQPEVNVGNCTTLHPIIINLIEGKQWQYFSAV